MLSCSSIQMAESSCLAEERGGKGPNGHFRPVSALLGSRHEQGIHMMAVVLLHPVGEKVLGLEAMEEDLRRSRPSAAIRSWA
mmetsp:Transcript_64235/g.114051  ORF Transcript_64235/g.114051 Transcript_64235/m.114051 type:complete len:82 (-) Transcript_64235:449-694(-)